METDLRSLKERIRVLKIGIYRASEALQRAERRLQAAQRILDLIDQLYNEGYIDASVRNRWRKAVIIWKDAAEMKVKELSMRLMEREAELERIYSGQAGGEKR